MVLPDQIKTLGFLVVEDNAFTSMELCRALRKLGAFEIETAEEGRSALNRLDEMKPAPSVILVDLRMPGMGGIELLERLAERHYSGHILICSGVDAETLEAVEKQARSYGLDIVASLGKPVSQHDLVDALEGAGAWSRADA